MTGVSPDLSGWLLSVRGFPVGVVVQHVFQNLRGQRDFRPGRLQDGVLARSGPGGERRAQASLTASVRSSRLRSAVACGSAARSWVHRSAASGRRPEDGLAGCRRRLGVHRTAGRMPRVRSAGRARSRGLSNRGPTSGRMALPRSRWPGCSSWPRLGRTTIDLLPDVVKVIALAQRRDNRHQTLRLPGAGVAELSMHIRCCMGVEARQIT